MNWKRHLTRQEAKTIRDLDRCLADLRAREVPLRTLRRLIQNRAYARGKSK